MQLALAIAFVVTGGYWQTPKNEGYYRVIVESGGWEHVTSRVYVEWIAQDQDKRELTVAASVRLDELGHKWSIGQPKLVPSKSGGATIKFSAVNSYEPDEPRKNFVIELGLPGKYRVRR